MSTLELICRQSSVSGDETQRDVRRCGALFERVRGEYEEMPGLCLTVTQAARLFDVEFHVAHAVLDELCRASILIRSGRGTYLLDG